MLLRYVSFILLFLRHGPIALFVLKVITECSNPESKCLLFYSVVEDLRCSRNLQVYGAEKLHEAIKNRPDGKSLITVWLLSDLVRRVSVCAEN